VSAWSSWRPWRKGVRSRRLPGTIVALIGLLALLLVGSLQGGIAMVANPLEPLGMTVAFLEDAPVHTYFWPGLFLLGIAAATTLALIGRLFDWRWHWATPIETATGHRWPWLGSLAIGGVLLAFEIIELWLVPFHPVMHPILIALSLALIAVPCTRSARAHLHA
jgi:hypothetical protein